MQRDGRAAEAFNDWTDRYVEKYMDVSKYAAGLDKFLSSIQKGGRVLELGCGPGNVTKYLFDRRPDLAIEATDPAANMLDFARGQLPTVSFNHLDIRDLHDRSDQLDGIVVAFVMPYLNKKELQNCLKEVYRLLKSNGTVYLSWIEDDHNKSGVQQSSSGTHAMNMYFYKLEELQAVFESIGLRCVFSENIPIDTSLGEWPKDAAVVLKKQS